MTLRRDCDRETGRNRDGAKNQAAAEMQTEEGKERGEVQGGIGRQDEGGCGTCDCFGSKGSNAEMKHVCRVARRCSRGMSPIITCARRQLVRRAISGLHFTVALAELSAVCMQENRHHERTKKAAVHTSWRLALSFVPLAEWWIGLYVNLWSTGSKST